VQNPDVGSCVQMKQLAAHLQGLTELIELDLSRNYVCRAGVAAVSHACEQLPGMVRVHFIESADASGG
jgi:hypothetical protein